MLGHMFATQSAHIKKKPTQTDPVFAKIWATGCKPWSSTFADRASHWKFRLHPVHLPWTWKGWPAPINGDALLEKSNEKGFNSRLDRLVTGRCWSVLSSYLFWIYLANNFFGGDKISHDSSSWFMISCPEITTLLAPLTPPGGKKCNIHYYIFIPP